MPIDPERNPQAMPQQKLRGLSVPNFLATIRAAAPEQAGIPDDALFHKFITEYPDEPQIRNLSGLSIGQMATIVRANAPDTGNVSDFQLVQDFLKQYPQENTRLSGAERAKLGLVKVADVLPIAGAIAGGLPAVTAAPGTAGMSLAAASGLSGLGAGAGTAAKQLIRRAVGADVPESSAEAAKEIAKEAGLNAAINFVGGKMIEGIAKVAKEPVKAAIAQGMKALEGIDERVAAKVLTDPEKWLLRAPTVEQAGKQLNKVLGGLEYGPEALSKVLGKAKASEAQADELINTVISGIEGPGMSVQSALAARYATARAAFKETDRNMQRYLYKKVAQVDEWLDKQLPGYIDALDGYEAAKISEKFKTFMPVNKNGQASVLRFFSNLGAIALSPLKGTAMAAASSPYIGGIAIKGGAMLKGAPIPFRAAAASAATETIVKRRKKPKETEAE